MDVTCEAGKHTGEITALAFDNDHVYSGGEDGVINVRSFLTLISKMSNLTTTVTTVLWSDIFFSPALDKSPAGVG